MIALKKQGIKPRLGPEMEEKLAELGFGPTLNEMIEIAGDYSMANELPHLFHDKLPGYAWAKNFMQKHKLYLKKSWLMQVDWVDAGEPAQEDGYYQPKMLTFSMLHLLSLVQDHLLSNQVHQDLCLHHAG